MVSLIKHKSRCLQKSKLLNWGEGKHVDCWGQAPLTPALTDIVG